MCDQIIIRANSTTKRASIAPEIHKIHKLEPPSFPISATPQLHSILIARWFNLAHSHPKTPILPRLKLPNPAPGQIILITGPSGSGKSTLLRRFRRTLRMPINNISRIRLTKKPVIDHFPHISIESALAHLSRVGLAEAHCYLLPPRHLSDGQRWRLRLALAISRVRGSNRGGMGNCTQLPVSCLLCDEFTSLLDPITAPIVARVLRRAIGPESNLCAILACSRTDILRALCPDLIIRCDFGNLQFWKKTKGESYVLAGETAQAPVLRSRPTRPATRHALRL
jgi:uncharacterized protein